MKASFAEMLRYNAWANGALFEACRTLDDNQLATRIPGTAGSIRELLAHIVAGQETLVARAKGGQQSSRGDWRGFAALTDAAARSTDALIAIADGLDDDLPVVVRYTEREYTFPRSFFLVQALAHGVEHRTEVKLTLASFGVQTPDLDSWSYGAAAGFARDAPPAN